MSLVLAIEQMLNGMYWLPVMHTVLNCVNLKEEGKERKVICLSLFLTYLKYNWQGNWMDIHQKFK